MNFAIRLIDGANPLMGGTVPLLDNQTPENRRIDWLAVIRTLLLQGLVLLALAGAVVVYLRWSSDANWSEFVSENGSPLRAAQTSRTVLGAGPERQRPTVLRSQKFSCVNPPHAAMTDGSTPSCASILRHLATATGGRE